MDFLGEKKQVRFSTKTQRKKRFFKLLSNKTLPAINIKLRILILRLISIRSNLSNAYYILNWSVLGSGFQVQGLQHIHITYRCIPMPGLVSFTHWVKIVCHLYGGVILLDWTCWGSSIRNLERWAGHPRYILNWAQFLLPPISFKFCSHKTIGKII